MQNNWHCRNLGSAFSWTSAVPLRVVKMQGHSFAPRSVMNSRSFVHFHSAGEGIRPLFFVPFLFFIRISPFSGGLFFISLTGECCAPFLRVSPATVPPERAPTVAGGHLRRSGTSASDAPPPRRRNVMPLAMRPLREQTAHCRRTPVLPSALTRSPPVATPTLNKRPSGIGDLFPSHSRVYRVSRA